MAEWFFLILVGALTYVLLQRSVARVSTTPWRVLWLIMNAPPAVFVISQQVFSYELPPLILLLLCLGSYIISVVLLRRGRTHQSEAASKGESRDLGTSSDTTQKAANKAEAITAVLGHTPISEVPREQLSNCFPWNLFYLQTVEYKPQAIICRGNLRGEPSQAYERVRDNVATTFGNRFLVVLQEGLAGKPFFALVPNPAARRTTPLEREQPGLAVGLLLFTIFTTLTAGALSAGIPPNQVMQPQSLLQGAPYALGLIAILGSHELTRFWWARRHRVQTSLPYFIPVPFAMGTFGAFIQLKEPVPNRKVLFDIGIAGPLAGSVVALTLLLVGLVLSQPMAAPTPTEGQAVLLNFKQIDPGLSILLAILAKVALGSRLAADQIVDLHPLAFAGWLGLIVTALNLMPVGQLDGGHIVHAVYGQQMGANIGRVARLIVLLLALTIQPWLRLWALLLFFISSADEPALNDVTDLDEGRDLIGLLMLTLLTLIVLPAPPFLQSWIGLS